MKHFAKILLSSFNAEPDICNQLNDIRESTLPLQTAYEDLQDVAAILDKLNVTQQIKDKLCSVLTSPH